MLCLKYTCYISIVFSNKSLTRIHTSLLGYCSSSTGYKSEKLVSDSPSKGGMIGTVYLNIPLSSANHCNVFLSYRVTPEVP